MAIYLHYSNKIHEHGVICELAVVCMIQYASRAVAFKTRKNYWIFSELLYYCINFQQPDSVDCLLTIRGI